MEKCILFVTTHGDGSDRLWLIRSKLPAFLVRRLLTYAAHEVRDGSHVLGEALFDLYRSEDDVTPLVNSLAEFVDPKVFNNDREGKYWCLLSNREEALSLYNDYLSDDRYDADAATNNAVSKQVYFKNRVDFFRVKIDEHWPPPVDKRQKVVKGARKR